MRRNDGPQALPVSVPFRLRAKAIKMGGNGEWEWKREDKKEIY